MVIALKSSIKNVETSKYDFYYLIEVSTFFQSTKWFAPVIERTPKCALTVSLVSAKSEFSQPRSTIRSRAG